MKAVNSCTFNTAISDDSTEAFKSLDVTLVKFKNEISSLCDKMMGASQTYVDARLSIQVAARLKSLYENNRPHPHWWNECATQELFQRIERFGDLEEHLKSIKDHIRKQKDVLLEVYNNMLQIYTQHGLLKVADEEPIHADEGDGPQLQVKDKLFELLRAVNVHIVHAMTALELLLAADEQNSVAIDEVILRQLGVPTIMPAATL